ncbi:DUF3093 domain-containing protein [Kocuria sp.]|uniref:DUF3093 domain-containing protein n=1 Tax=Kocuria sp. TaxID=1871328 RepID=UPI0028110B79|nr:DUF3093 domain-containing protein [Kocuria sp.]HST72195.1 DUF3093 domain-containing protein [Kocuria rosea]
MSHPASSSASPADDPRRPRPSGPDGTGSEVLYEERLSPAWWMWLLVLFVGAVVFVSLAPVNPWVAAAAAVVAAGGAGIALAVSSPSIVVTREHLQVGRARIERRFVGEAEAFRGDAVRWVRGPELDARAYMNFRASVGPVVRIRITDPVDPTPYWLTSSRHPERIVEVLAGR